MKVTVAERNTVAIVLYTLYKANMLSRNNLRQMFDIMAAPGPEDVMKYLTDEIVKLKPARS